MQRRPLIMGNWKMSLSRATATSLARRLKRELAGRVVDCDIAVCPSHIHLTEVNEILAGSTIRVGAQDCAWQSPGAVTGAVSAAQIRELGLRWVILGHSERRAIFGEDDAILAAKVRAAFDSGLEVVLCVGETETQRDAGQTEAVVLAQLEGALSASTEAAKTGLTLAYEPVWAIGTGRNAVSADVAEVHASLRGAAARLLGDDVALALRILYGGSVKPANIAEYIGIDDVDGALVGGASLDIESFLDILTGV